jgi:hypothetical protein
MNNHPADILSAGCIFKNIIDVNGKEYTMDDTEDPEVDIDQLLQGLLALSGDEELRLDVVEKLAQRTNMSPAQAEVLMKAAIEYLKNRSPRTD